MNKDEIRKAYEELNFSKNMQSRYFRNITSREEMTQKKRRFRLAPVLLCVFLLGTTVYAAERLDLLGWYYGKEAAAISQKADTNSYTAQNQHLKISVESAVFTEEYGNIFVHVQALDEEGKKFMQENCRWLSMEVEMYDRTEEAAMRGGSSTRDFLDEISDEENWYYSLESTSHHEVSETVNYDTAIVRFPGSAQEADQWTPESLRPIQIEFSIADIVDNRKVYTKCGSFDRIAVSPLTVTLEWKNVLEEGKSCFERVETLEILMKDGSTVMFNNQIGTNPYEEGSAWKSCLITESAEDNSRVMTLISSSVLDVEQIDSVILNGAACEL